MHDDRGFIVARFAQLPRLINGAAFCLWANRRQLHCIGCGVVVPYVTADEGPHTRESGKHRPAIFVATGQRGAPEIPLDRVRIAPESEVALHGALLLRLWQVGMIGLPVDREIEAAIYRTGLIIAWQAPQKA